MTLAASLGSAAGAAITDWLRAQSSMAGQITPWPAAGNIPVGWLECDGRALSPADYPRLFAVIGTAYGGDGVATFNLPDLRGRVPLGRSASRAAGTQVGAESVSVTLDSANLPSHSHGATFTSSTASSTSVSVAIPVDAVNGAESNVPSTSTVLGKVMSGTTAARAYTTNNATTTLKPFDVTVPMPSITGSVAIGSTGTGQPLNIPTLPPAVVMIWVICTGIGVTQPVGYSWHGVKTTYQSLSQADLTTKLAADAEFASAVAIMLAAGQMTDRIGGSYARWDFDQAKLDAVNLSLSDLQNRMNPAHASYSSRFTDMYKMLVGAGIVSERFPVVRLLPVLTSGNANRLTADWAAGNGLPSGRISASSTQNATDTYAVWKAADSSGTSSNWYPASYTQIGSWIQIQLSQAFFPRTIFFRTSPSNYRPTAVKIQAGNSVTSLVDIASFTLAAPASGASFGEYLLTLPMAGSYTILRMTVTAVADTAVIGYPIYDWYATGVLGV